MVGKIKSILDIEKLAENKNLGLNKLIKKILFLNKNIIKQVKPIWYYNIFNQGFNDIWIDYSKLDPKIKNEIDIFHG